MRFQTLRSRSRGGAGEGPSPRPRLLLPGRRRLGEGCPRLLPARTLSHSYPHQSCAGAPKPHTRSNAHAQLTQGHALGQRSPIPPPGRV